MSEVGPSSSECGDAGSAATEAGEASEPQGWPPAASMRWLVVGCANGQPYLQGPAAEGGWQGEPVWAPSQCVELDPAWLERWMAGEGPQLAWAGAVANAGTVAWGQQSTGAEEGRGGRGRMPGEMSPPAGRDEQHGQQVKEERRERNRKAQRVFREKQKKIEADLNAQLKELGGKVRLGGGGWESLGSDLLLTARSVGGADWER
ncbi:unnamed protein product [Ostreobium quekettii]|uniref:BZIP domain-containing protein n=1 Tax=Ostreobium quekettii TaxID=121088 RepID=A0A8S1INZ2_9CHLO|nr:unnamed protein product [Ostreobium quekettii]|eukprot:evm.model.scf_408.1 EVM.evm.TU.scf_408.1   scf_408:10520-11389(-)